MGGADDKHGLKKGFYSLGKAVPRLPWISTAAAALIAGVEAIEAGGRGRRGRRQPAVMMGYAG
jgi:hypothetical protein